MQVREALVAHHALGEDLHGLADRLNSRHLQAAVGPDAVVLAVGKISMGDPSLKIIRLQSWTDQFLRTSANSSRLRFWSSVSLGCNLSLDGFSWNQALRLRWIADFENGCFLAVSFLASVLVEWCLLKATSPR